MFHEQSQIYTASLPRITYFICGVSVGYMLHIYATPVTKQNAHLQFMRSIINFFRRPILSNWFTCTMMVHILFLPLWISFAIPHLPERFTMFFNTNTTLIAVGITIFLYSYIGPILLIQLATGTLGNSSFMQRCWNSSFWLPLSRISITVLLADLQIIALLHLRHDQTIRLTTDQRIADMISLSVCTYFLSFLAYLAFESPCKTLLKLVQDQLLFKYANRRRSSNTINDSLAQ